MDNISLGTFRALVCFRRTNDVPESVSSSCLVDPDSQMCALHALNPPQYLGKLMFVVDPVLALEIHGWMSLVLFVRGWLAGVVSDNNFLVNPFLLVYDLACMGQKTSP